MRYKNYFFLSTCFICLGISIQSYPQVLKDTINEVEIREKKIIVQDKKSDFSTGQKLKVIDSLYLSLYHHQSLSMLLSQQSSLFIKSYGVNGMSTLNFRGASAAQSGVLWNGIPIINPALGVADISLLQTGLFSHVDLQYGSSSSLLGSGNVGGAVLLRSNKPDFTNKRRYSMYVGTGSFGRMDAGLNSVFENSRWHISLNAFYQKAKNDFTYYTNDFPPYKERLNNAELKALGTTLSVEYNMLPYFNKFDNESISLHLWMQKYEREIPPALFESQSQKQQEDLSLRGLLHWKKTKKKNYFYFKSSFAQEKLHYTDPMVRMNNQNTVHLYYQEVGWMHSFSTSGKTSLQHQLLAFIPLHYSFAQGDNLDELVSQLRPAVVVNYGIRYKKLKTNITVRQEWMDQKILPVVPGINSSYELYNGKLWNNKTIEFILKGNVQKTYRVPTLNELYYFPGGNIELKPESGWNEDGGYALSYTNYANDPSHLSIKLEEVKHELSLFNRNISNWIYWMGGAIWTPHNIAKVHSRGIETDNSFNFSIGKVKLLFNLNTAYVLATTQASYLHNDNSKGKQIPYAPRYNGHLNAGLAWRRLFFNYNHTYTGYRFVTIDESDYLSPYHTGNAQAVYRITYMGCEFSFSLQVNNIWNQNFEIVKARPFPGRNFAVQLKAGLNGK